LAEQRLNEGLSAIGAIPSRPAPGRIGALTTPLLGETLEFAADQSTTGLSAYLDEIGAVLKRDCGILKLAETMQVLHRSGASFDFGKAIDAALSVLATS
jgi:hypothetical protein